ncbi:unnamed protein product [Caenorhabditis brenneri]
MSMTPMSYECIECLLRHMDANTRIQISNRCPSIRALEKRVPLKIKALKLMRYGVELNNVAYSIGIIRKYKEGRIPNTVARNNENGGVEYEVDRYGIEDISDATTITPGDVEIVRPGMDWGRRNPVRIDEAEMIRSLEDRIQMEALKHLTTVLFGGRSSPIYVKEMTLNCLNRQECVIRLPYGLKFHVQCLTLPFALGNKLEALAPIIHETSYPLKFLSIDVYSERDVTNPVVQSAEELEVYIRLGNPLQILQILPNDRVRLIVHPDVFSDMERIVRDWIAANRPVGAVHIFEMNAEPVFLDEMENILKRFNGVVIDEENVIIPMNDAVQLKVTYGPFPEFSPKSNWAFKLLNEAFQH